MSRFTLALATWWSSNHDVSLHRAEPLIWLCLPFEFKFDLRRLEDDHLTAALLALAALPPVLAEAAATALLAQAALPPVLADAAASALLTPSAPPPVLTDAASSALLALAALPPVLADAGAAALLAFAALPTVLADAGAAALLARAALPPVLALFVHHAHVRTRGPTATRFLYPFPLPPPLSRAFHPLPNLFFL